MRAAQPTPESLPSPARPSLCAAPGSVWPCPTCGARNMEEAGNLCRADWVCSADEQRMLEWEREHFTPNKGYTTSRPYIDGGAFGAQTRSWQKFTPIGTTPATPKNTPPVDTSRLRRPAVCISGHANSTRNSFNARGLCTPTPLNQHRKILHPLTRALRLRAIRHARLLCFAVPMRRSSHWPSTSRCRSRCHTAPVITPPWPSISSQTRTSTGRL